REFRRRWPSARRLFSLCAPGRAHKVRKAAGPMASGGGILVNYFLLRRRLRGDGSSRDRSPLAIAFSICLIHDFGK
ncbi:MAG: hypothetical protein ACLQBA_18215, partial [Candidatus Binataceae bacterium]